MDEGAKSAGAIAPGMEAWLHRQPRVGLGAGAIFCATTASFGMHALGLGLGLVMMLPSPHELSANPRFWITAWTVGYPALSLVNAAGICAGVWLWLAPEVVARVSCGRVERALGRVAPAAAMFVAADAVLTVLRVFFPPAVLGGGALPLWAALTFKALGWIAVLLGVPFAWWLWRTIHSVVRLHLPSWQHFASALSWAWPAQLAGVLLASAFQDCFGPSAGATLGATKLLLMRASADVLALSPAASLVIDVASLSVLLALLRPGRERAKA